MYISFFTTNSFTRVISNGFFSIFATNRVESEYRIAIICV